MVPGNRWDLLHSAPGRSAVAAETTEISVVVPFYDNQHDLDLLLTALSVQTHPHDRLQIVIADDGSPEGPRVPEAARGLDIEIVRQEHAGFRAGTARNLGAARSDGEVILFLDGDTVPSPSYVQHLAGLPSVLPDAVVSGRRRYADLSRWTPDALLDFFAGQRAEPEIWNEPSWMTREYDRTQDLLAVHPRSYKYLIGAVLGCSREMFQGIGGFDESFVGYGGEDYDFTYRAYNAGAVLAYVPEAVAWHDGRDWSGRTDPAQQTEQKNREVMVLAARIPEPSMRGAQIDAGQIYSVVDVLVEVHTDGWAFGAGVMCVRSLLAHLDCAVTILGTGEPAAQLRAAFRDDPRVRNALSTHAVVDPNGGRARLHLSVSEPVRLSAEFSACVQGLLERDVGTFTVSTHGRPIITAQSHRSRSRIARHTGVPEQVAGEWFAHSELELDDSGIILIDGEPKLAALFGGY